MVEPEKPFACSMPDCGMTFTNEDHLHVHTKKHDMILQFGLEQKAAFVADQTPTPTRFIRNCEEVGLFLDLQNDNPFEEGFKRAMETAKHGLSSMEHPVPATEDLHTPQMVFPLIDQTDSTLFTSNNQQNITISRSSSDESGAIKEYETTTISKLTNEVTTISRRVEKHDTEKQTDETTKLDKNKDVSETSVSYTNNVIKIIKDTLVNVECSQECINHNNLISYTDSVIKDINNVNIKDTIEIPTIMSQKSIDNVVESLTTDFCKHNVPAVKELNKNDSEQLSVTITMPDGKKIKMKAVDELKTVNDDTKEKLKNVIASKSQPIPVIQNIGTLIPVTLIPQVFNKVPIVPLVDKREVKPMKRRRVKTIDKDCVVEEEKERRKLSREDLSSRVAASRRYRVRLRETMENQVSEIKRLKESNQQLSSEVATLKQFIMEHMKTCPNTNGISISQRTTDIPDNT